MDDTQHDAPQRARRGTAEEAERLVVATITAHAESLLRTARRHSLCADDAYQRGLEIFLRHAARLDPERASRWLHTVVEHEAMAVRRLRQQLVASEEIDFDGHEPATSPPPRSRSWPSTTWRALRRPWGSSSRRRSGRCGCRCRA